MNCGHAFPEHEIAIVDETGKRLADRQVGQIVTRGPSVSTGLLPGARAHRDRSARRKARVPDGRRRGCTPATSATWSTGEVFICGRLKDMIIVRGRNFYPSDIEWVVSELPGVRRGNVVAFSRRDRRRGAARRHGRGHVLGGRGPEGGHRAARSSPTFALTPHEVVIVPQGTLPRTSSGKPQRRKTRQMYLDGTLARARSVQGTAGQTEEAGASA